jgi:hypothetical protein
VVVHRSEWGKTFHESGRAKAYQVFELSIPLVSYQGGYKDIVKIGNVELTAQHSAQLVRCGDLVAQLYFLP